nr:hypothetical protein [Tanacetum cinerariifolium]
LIAQKEEARIQLQAEEFDLMAAVADLDDIEEVNANCILMANLQQVLTSGTQTDKAPIYDSDGSAESQFQPQATSYQSSPYGPTYHNSQFVSSGPSSLTHSISYPGTDTSFLVNHNAYMASSSAPQISYAQMDQQSPEYSPPEAGLVVPVFQKGDDPIDAINHMMSFLTSVCTKPRRKRDAEWFKDKVLLVQAQPNGQVLQEEELEFLADP